MQDISSKTVSRRYAKSSSFKMAVLFTLLLGASACFLGYSLYDIGQNNFLRETEAAIDSEIEHIQTIIQNNLSSQTIHNYIQTRADRNANPIYFYQNINENVQTGHLRNMPVTVERIKEGIISFRHKGTLYAAKIHTLEDGSKLLIGRDISDITASYERLKSFSFLIIAFMMAVILVSFFISSFVVSRINIIASTAKQIMDTGDLSARISINSSWDDLSNLAQVLNNLLDRIENLMFGIRDVSDSIAHDLRTPLTRLRNHLEDIKKTSQQPEDVDKIINEADDILKTFNALLRIANIEKSTRHQKFTEVDIRTLVCDVIELYEPLAEHSDITIKDNLQANITIQGDKDLLFQAISNIMDNAIKFSPENSAITVSLKRKKNKTSLSIADQGIGIAPQNKERVFDRFYRAEHSRTTSGSGLGLSLVKAICDLHKINISLRDNTPGLAVELSFKD